MPFTIDPQLTPSTASQIGYEWVKNVIYDPEAPPEAMKDILDLLNTGNYKLGKAATDMPSSPFTGLYRKME